MTDLLEELCEDSKLTNTCWNISTKYFYERKLLRLCAKILNANDFPSIKSTKLAEPLRKDLIAWSDGKAFA